MNLVIVHGGQTGVDRGAHEGALDAGLPISGYMPKDGRDERGLIPQDVAKFLMRCPQSGMPARTVANVTLCHAVLLVVQDADDPGRTRGTRLTMEEARYQRRPRLIVDPETEHDEIRQWITTLLEVRQQRALDVTRLMVAGPREERWANGRAEAAGFVRMIGASFGPRAPKK